MHNCPCLPTKGGTIEQREESKRQLAAHCLSVRAAQQNASECDELLARELLWGRRVAALLRLLSLLSGATLLCQDSASQSSLGQPVPVCRRRLVAAQMRAPRALQALCTVHCALCAPDLGSGRSHAGHTAAAALQPQVAR